MRTLIFFINIVSDRPPVDGWFYRLKRVLDCCETLRVADFEITSWHQHPGQPIHQQLLGGAIKIDHDIAAENNMERPLQRIEFLE